MAKYPDVEVNLSNSDGNSFSIICRVSSALRRAGVSENEIDEYREKATSGNYDNVLRVTMDTVQTT